MNSVCLVYVGNPKITDSYFVAYVFRTRELAEQFLDARGTIRSGGNGWILGERHYYCSDMPIFESEQEMTDLLSFVVANQ